METKYIKINEDGSCTEEKVQPENEKMFKLRELQEFVGGYIELVDLLGDFVMVVNEEGKITGLPLNSTATKIFQEIYGAVDVICGNVLICDKNQIE